MKTVDKKETVKVCNDCGNPIVYTFIYSGAEYYCPSCGVSRDCFFGKEIKATPELLKKKEDIQKRFDTARKHILSGGARLRDCEKCSQERHFNHLTPEEKKLHFQGLKDLKAMILPQYQN